MLVHEPSLDRDRQGPPREARRHPPDPLRRAGLQGIISRPHTTPPLLFLPACCSNMKIDKVAAVLFLIPAIVLAGPVAAAAEESVDLHFLPLAPPGAAPRHRFHAAAIGAIALAAVVVVVAGVVFAYICCCRRNEEDVEDRGVRPGDLQLVPRT